MSSKQRSTTMGRPRASVEQIQARRQALVAAAFEVFGEHGYRDTGIDAITARAGVGFGSFYRSFKSKRELIDHTIDYGIELIIGEVQVEIDAPATTFEELGAQIRSMVRRLYEIFRTRPALARILFLESTSVDDELTARVVSLTDLGVSFVASYLGTGHDSGYLTPDLPATPLARAVFGIILSGLVAYATDPTATVAPDDYAELAVRLLSTYAIDRR